VDEDGKPIQLSDVEKEGDGGIGDEGTLDGRLQSPKAEVKEELKEVEASAPTPKRKRAAKGAAAKVEHVETADIKPDVEGLASDANAKSNENGEEEVQGEPKPRGKAPPKKRAKKSAA
jgi:hypothetical protein